MEIQISILAGTITALLFGINVILAKRNLKGLDSNTHIFMKYLTVALFAIFPVINNWKLTLGVYPLLMTLGVVVSRGVYGYTYSKLLKNVNTAFVSLVVQSHVILIAVIETIMGLDKNLYVLSSVLIIFISGMYFILGVKRKEIQLNKNNVLLLLIAFSCLALRPFFIRPILSENMVNNQTLMFLEFTVVSIVYFFVFKPNLRVLNNKLKINYGIQGILSFIGNVSTNYGFTYGIVTITSLFLSLELIVVLLFSMLFLKEKLKAKQIGGILLCFIAFLLINYL